MPLSKLALRLVEWRVVPENLIDEEREVIIQIGLASRKDGHACKGFMCQWFYEVVGSTGIAIRWVGIQEFTSDEKIEQKKIIEMVYRNRMVAIV